MTVRVIKVKKGSVKIGKNAKLVMAGIKSEHINLKVLEDTRERTLPS